MKNRAVMAQLPPLAGLKTQVKEGILDKSFPIWGFAPLIWQHKIFFKFIKQEEYGRHLYGITETMAAIGRETVEGVDEHEKDMEASRVDQGSGDRINPAVLKSCTAISHKNPPA